MAAQEVCPHAHPTLLPPMLVAQWERTENGPLDLAMMTSCKSNFKCQDGDKPQIAGKRSMLMQKITAANSVDVCAEKEGTVWQPGGQGLVWGALCAFVGERQESVAI